LQTDKWCRVNSCWLRCGMSSSALIGVFCMSYTADNVARVS